MGSVEGPEWTLRSRTQQQRRIDRSETNELMSRLKRNAGLKDRVVTHKDKDPISVCFPVVSHPLVFFFRHFQVL